MRIVRLGLVLAIALSTVAFTNTAMAGKHGQKGANQNAPGQEWKARKDDAGAVSPGQEWKLRKDDAEALSPGQQFKSLGTPSNPIPGPL